MGFSEALKHIKRFKTNKHTTVGLLVFSLAKHTQEKSPPGQEYRNHPPPTIFSGHKSSEKRAPMSKQNNGNGQTMGV